MDTIGNILKYQTIIIQVPIRFSRQWHLQLILGHDFGRISLNNVNKAKSKKFFCTADKVSLFDPFFPLIKNKKKKKHFAQKLFLCFGNFFCQSMIWQKILRMRDTLLLIRTKWIHVNMNLANCDAKLIADGGMVFLQYGLPLASSKARNLSAIFLRR